MGSKWQMEKHNDPYYKQAKKEEYRSRASFKLKQLIKGDIQSVGDVDESI